MSEHFKLSSGYNLLWERFQAHLKSHRLPHALLLVGYSQEELLNVAYLMAGVLFCQGENKPCQVCKSCRLLTLRQHPDLTCIQPEKLGASIKIDQIRDLQTLAYISPQLGDKRLIFICSAERLNESASNALLKNLEEPPDSLMFILLAEQISSISPTVLSRCQKWFSLEQDVTHASYLQLRASYPVESEKGKIFSQIDAIIQDLHHLVERKVFVCKLASEWGKYEFYYLIWLIHLITAQMLHYHFLHPERSEESASLYLLSQKLTVPLLFEQLKVLNQIRKKLNKQIAINQLLSLEHLLLGYIEYK